LKLRRVANAIPFESAFWCSRSFRGERSPPTPNPQVRDHLGDPNAGNSEPIRFPTRQGQWSRFCSGVSSVPIRTCCPFTWASWFAGGASDCSSSSLKSMPERVFDWRLERSRFGRPSKATSSFNPTPLRSIFSAPPL
jgi:hypothetical protein